MDRADAIGESLAGVFLKEAVAGEEYEEASKLRDKIRAIEEKRRGSRSE